MSSKLLPIENKCNKKFKLLYLDNKLQRLFLMFDKVFIQYESE